MVFRTRTIATLATVALLSIPTGVGAGEYLPVGAKVVAVDATDVSDSGPATTRVMVSAAVTNGDGTRPVVVAPDDERLLARRVDPPSLGYTPLIFFSCEAVDIHAHPDYFTASTTGGSSTASPEPTPVPTPTPTSTPLSPVAVRPGMTSNVGRAYGFGEILSCGGHSDRAHDWLVFAVVTWHYARDNRRHVTTSPVVKVTVR